MFRLTRNKRPWTAIRRGKFEIKTMSNIPLRISFLYRLFISGDPESSDNDTNEYETSSSDVEIVPLLPPSSVSNHEVITLSDSDNDIDNGLNESSDEGWHCR